MEIKSANYIGSYPTLDKCPKPGLPEFAFIGRSNVGKSSLLNMLCGRKDLAHVSKTPGKTLAINYYLINYEWYLVDLPGYGYAKRAKSMRKSFSKMITDYFMYRETLACSFVLIDVNVPPRDNDMDFINWLGEAAAPFVIAYTKSDKLSNAKQEDSIATIQAKILESWETLPQQFITSSAHRIGREEVLGFIEGVNSSMV